MRYSYNTVRSRGGIVVCSFMVETPDGEGREGCSSVITREVSSNPLSIIASSLVKMPLLT